MPRKFATPPPWSAELPVMVLFVTVRVPPWFLTPPPPYLKLEFPEMVLCSTVRVPSPVCATPPPPREPVFAEIVLCSTVGDRNFKRCFSVPLPVAARRLEPQERQRVAGGGRRCRLLQTLGRRK